MKLLSIDTSTKNFSLAVSNKEGKIRYCNKVLGRKLSSSVVPEIKKILKKAEITLADLDGFVIGLGPGGFTGLRVGLATIKGLAFAVNKPVVGISSLDVLAMNVKEGGKICSICDARRNMVYAGFYEKLKSHLVKGDLGGCQLLQKGKYQLTDIQTVLKQIDGETILIGDGIKVFSEEIQKSKQSKFITLADENLWLPQARHLLELGLKRFEEKKFDDINTLGPLYLYPDDCQVRKP